jgi:hypothetical protein
MGEMKRRQCGVFPLAAKVAGGGDDSDTRPVTLAVALALFGARGGRKPTGLVGPKRPSGPAGPIGPKARREFLFELK